MSAIVDCALGRALAALAVADRAGGRRTNARRRPTPFLPAACGTARRRTFAASGRCAAPPTRTSKAIRRKKASPPRKSIVVDPPDGKIPYKPEALAQRQENYRTRATADPSLKCLSGRRAARDVSRDAAADSAEPRQLRDRLSGESRVSRLPSRTRGRTSTTPTGGWATRVIGGRATRWSPTSSRMTDQAWLDQAGNFHSTEVHIVERYRMTGADTLEYEARIEDPVVYSRPWTLRTVLYRVKAAGSAHHRGRVPGGRERRAPSYLAVPIPGTC